MKKFVFKIQNEGFSKKKIKKREAGKWIELQACVPSFIDSFGKFISGSWPAVSGENRLIRTSRGRQWGSKSRDQFDISPIHSDRLDSPIDTTFRVLR